jgi:hypothetical protein
MVQRHLRGGYQERIAVVFTVTSLKMKAVSSTETLVTTYKVTHRESS